MGDPVTSAGVDAPAVVTVAVMRRRNAATEALLDALGAQTYPTIAHVVIDATGDPDVPHVVGAHLPGAVIRQVDPATPWSAAANQVRRLVEGAAFYLFVDDRTVLDADTVERLVEETFRSNAAVAGPKVVDALEPRRIVTVGGRADRFGHVIPLAEVGEHDQEQHDAVRDVFVVPRGCQLVRTDLFATLGGFDPALGDGAEALDLCWRAHLAGGRVLSVPAGRARRWIEPGHTEPQPAEHQRLRTTLVCTGRWRLPGLIASQALLSALAVVGGLLARRPRRSAAAIGAWWWAVSHLGEIRRARARLAPARVVGDSEIRNLQASGLAHAASLWRDPAERGTRERLGTLGSRLRDAIVSFRAGRSSSVLGAWLVLLAVLLVGSRHLIDGRVPIVGNLVSLPTDPGALVEAYAKGWTTTGFGSSRAPSTGIGLLAGWDLLLPGSADAARVWALLGGVLAGWIGMWRLCRLVAFERAGRPWARPTIVGTLAYAAMPVAMNAIGSGRAGGVVAYATLPWVVANLLRVGELTPSVPLGMAGAAARVGLVAAVGMAFVPLLPAVVVGVALTTAVGSLIGRTGSPLRCLQAGAIGSVLAVVLNLPWSLELRRPDGAWAQFGSIKMASPAGRGVGSLARFDTGPISAGVIGLGMVSALVFVVIVARHWRLAVAGAAITTFVGFLMVAWAGDRFLLPFPLPSAEVLLAPAAVAVALAVALGITTFAHDVEGTAFSLGRQPLAFVAVLLTVVAFVPGTLAIADGRWELPRADFNRSLSSLSARPQGGAFRVLWVGDPRALPTPGWWLADGVGWAVTDGLATPAANFWAGTPTPTARRASGALNLAGADQTDRLGRLLAPLGVRYVIVPLQTAPSFTGAPTHLPPAALLESLVGQLDLRRINLDDAAAVFENTAWVPARAALVDPPDISADAADVLRAGEVDGTPVLVPDPSGDLTAIGPVPAGTVVIGTPSDRWALEVDGAAVTTPDDPGAWIGPRLVSAAGSGRLELDWSATRLIWLALQAVAWGATYGVGHARTRSRRVTAVAW